MEITVKALYEPLDVTIEGPGDAVTVHASVDVSADNLLDIAGACIGASDKMAVAGKLIADARARRDVRAIKKVTQETARIVEDALVLAIGRDSLDEVVGAATGGDNASPSACYEVLGAVLMAVKDIVMARYGDRMDEKAAHYLSEVADAQPEPDAGN